MKSLYTILGVRPDASADKIEKAYAALLHELKDGPAAATGSDSYIRLVAVKEAYSVLSDPTARRLYDQKLFAPQTIAPKQDAAEEPARGRGMAMLIGIGVIVIGAIWAYSHNAMEKERLRIEHEKQIFDAALKLEHDRIEQNEAEKETMLARQDRREAEARERDARERAIRESRELSYRLQQQEREQERKKQQETYAQRQAAREQLYLQQQEEARQRQQRYEAERQLEREKRALRELQSLR